MSVMFVNKRESFIIKNGGVATVNIWKDIVKMTKGKEVLKKNKEEWNQHQWIWEGYKYIMTYNKKNFYINHELTGKTITKGKFQE
tara:strand:- start:188 stop:442 length:255 start_codon:yes stop_codon:yes gene_type:complete